jgi:hypothetical protein
VEVNLVKDALAAVGASTEVQTLAHSLLGEVTLTADSDAINANNHRPRAAMLGLYESHRQQFDSALRQAVTEMQTTGTVSDATLRNVSVPGQPLPRAAVDALAALQQDQVRYESLIGKLETGLAVTQLTWECQDLQEQLSAATEANAQLTDEQKKMLQRRYDSLQRDLAAVMQKKEVLERHLQPAVDALLAEYTAMQSVATRAGVNAPTLTVPTMPYQRQQPAGYSQ